MGAILNVRKALFAVFGGLDRLVAWANLPACCLTFSGAKGTVGANFYRNLKKRPLKFRLQGPPKPNQQCAPTNFSIGLASLILRETCGTIRCTEQHFYTMMLSHNRFLRLMTMHSILKKDGVHFSVPLVSHVVKMYLKDLYTNF